jgi:hypothetical protein
MLTEVAPLVVQERVAAFPSVTFCGVALNVEIVGAGGGETMIVMLAVAEPLALVAVRV